MLSHHAGIQGSITPQKSLISFLNNAIWAALQSTAKAKSEVVPPGFVLAVVLKLKSNLQFKTKKLPTLGLFFS